ncbi:hypothetical protein GMSM_12440 [Geomonas sp. Red276]
MNASDRFVMNHREMSPMDLMLYLEDTATLQDAHPKISVEKDGWVPGAPEFRQHKQRIAKELENAAALKVSTTKELEEARAAAVEDIMINADYMVLRARQSKDDSWLHNNGYQMKDKLKRSLNRMISAIALVLRVKNGPGKGEVTVSWDKDPVAGSYQLQFCKGEPQGDESYADHAYCTKVRTVISNLDRANWYYFRGRSIGHNETGPWSDPVGIIVT